MSRLTIALCLVVSLLGAPSAIAEDRLALVIGNGGYENVPALANPVNDAKLMTRTLRQAGFRVETLTEADRATMVQAIERFSRDVRAARPGSVALFYYAGHGVRSDGFNYLVPLKIDLGAEADLPREAIAAEWVLERIDAPDVTSVMVLDACRDNPFDGVGPRTIPELGDGLARMKAQNQNLIAYATGPGDVAFDGAGENSPYTAALARAILTPDLDIEGIFTKVRDEVVAATQGLQVPWESSALKRAVYVKPGVPTPGPEGDPNGDVVRLAIGFNPGRWAGGRRSCVEIYRYEPVSVPLGTAEPRRLDAINGNSAVSLDVTSDQTAAGVQLSIVPIAKSSEGRPITVRLDEIKSGQEQVFYSHSRHPDLFDCGTMTVYISLDG